MRVSHRWLTELLPGLDLSAERLAERLTMLGLLVEELVRADRGLESVVLGRVLEAGPHPAAERLKVCLVQAGPDGDPRRVVCGAPVVREGAFYPLALPGATLPGGVLVEASQIRGVRSEGMLCSAPELGLEHLGGPEGILELDPAGAAPGAPVAPLLGLDDTVLVLELPSNRPDWESHLGVARELRALAGGRLVLPEGAAGGARGEAAPARVEGAAGTAAETAEAGGVRVRLLDPSGCPRYTGRVLRGIRVGPAPAWAQGRLAALGVRPINNVVDATNLVLLELGTPLHAFDLARLRGAELRVRRGAPGERLVTLDGRERVLDPEITVIADAERAVGVGGVMGGQDSEVSAATGEVFLEAGYFEPERVRKSAARLGLRTEASQRFGRGVDRGAVPAGLARATSLIAGWAGATPDSRGFDLGGPGPARPTLSLRPERVRAITSLALSDADIAEALSSADLPVERRDGALRVAVPGHRYDLAREIDLVEEVARRAGYEHVPAEPLPVPPGSRPRGEAERVAALRETLRGLGLDEAYTPTFLDPAPFGPGFYEGRLVEQVNPLAQNEPYLRPAVCATLLLAGRHNLRRGSAGVALFEVGHAFERDTGEPASEPEAPPAEAVAGLPRLPGIREARRLGVVLAGTPWPPDWSGVGRDAPADFFDVKGLAETLSGSRPALEASPAARAWLHPGQQADLRLDGRLLGFAGRLHPRVERELGLGAQTCVLELALEPLLAERAPRAAAPVSPFPRVERDVALVVPDELDAARVLERIRRARLENLAEVRLFDVYRGDPVPAGARSLAYRLVFQAPERTLTEADVEREMGKLLAALAGTGVRLR